jgi:hypothetical protein
VNPSKEVSVPAGGAPGGETDMVTDGEDMKAADSRLLATGKSLTSTKIADVQTA